MPISMWNHLCRITHFFSCQEKIGCKAAKKKKKKKVGQKRNKKRIPAFCTAHFLKEKKKKNENKTKLEFRGSWLTTHLLYSENIERGPPLGGGTIWVVLVPTTTHIPTQVPHSITNKKKKLKFSHIFFMAQKFGLPNKFGKVASLCSTCANHYPHTKFHQCSQYRTLDICLFCY